MTELPPEESISTVFDADLIDCGGRRLWVNLELKWSAQRALYFEVLINGSDAHDWIISRDLLSAGIAGRAGEMDVVVYPDGDPDTARDLVIIRLDAPSGRCEFRVDRFDVDLLVSRTVREVPFGAEVTPPDTVPAEWLGLIGDGTTP